MSNNQIVTNNDAVPFVTVNPDGTYSRPIVFPTCLPTPDQDSDIRVLSKDVTINDIHRTGARIHILKETITSTACEVEKLPLLVYYHGGGFVAVSSCTKVVHDLCDELASQLSVVVVSVDYRLAPEHRLPAAYEDGVEVLHWIKSTQDDWITKYVDSSKCYLMGTSAGANLAYHAGLRASTEFDGDLESSLKIKGLILNHLFIGGVERTNSEIRLANAESLNLATSDMFWDFCLPVGANRDHEYSNLKMDGMDRIKDLGWRVMMAIRDGDLLTDRQIRFVKTLELKGIETKFLYGEGSHGIEYFDKGKAKELLDEISSFMSSIDQVGTNINGLTVENTK